MALKLQTGIARRRHLALAVCVALGCASMGRVSASEPRRADNAELLRQLSERIEKLEKSNAELQTRQKGEGSELEQRVKQLEQQNEALENALDRDNLSEKDPQLATRLKATEAKTLNMQHIAKLAEALEGVQVGVTLTTVAQRANRGVKADGSGGSELNYRGDVAVLLPGGELGRMEGKLFAQVRVGQGNGLASSTPRFSPSNATAFQLGGVSQADDSGALLAQAWYQLHVPLFRDQGGADASRHLNVVFGKIDPYLFFDQNAAANDENRQFLNSVFVHNALLDAGHGSGVDAYGYAPGVVLAYHDEAEKPLSYAFSAGFFSAGPGARYQQSFSSPFAIFQAETLQKLFNGLDGNYRAYVWRNGQGVDFDQQRNRHRGWGISVDQRVGDGLTLFARGGKQTRGRVAFDQTLTAGAEIGGLYWGRAADAVGVAWGRQRSSADYRSESATLDADGDGQPDFGYQAQGAEQVAELYYRFRVHGQFELTPDFQYIRRPGANGAEAAIKAVGLRAQVNF